MIKRVLALLLIVSASLFAAVTVTVDKDIYEPAENIKVTLSGMPGNEGDWVGIFPKGSSNDWSNVKTWRYDGHVTDGTHTLDGVEAGEYEARVFLDNSYTLLAKTSFKVEEAHYNTTVTTEASYNINEPIKVTLSGMPGNEGDWVGIFPKDSTNEWKNVLTWKYDGEVVDGTYYLDGVEAGEYEARVFLNNSFTLLAKSEFLVTEANYNTKVTTSKSQFYTGEPIRVTLSGMPGYDGDWVGIFEKDAANQWQNAIAWKYDGEVNDGTYDLDSVPVGEYEVRVFLNDTLTVLDSASFTVVEKPISTTISTNKTTYEDGEKITVSVTNMLGNQRDWVGIFEAGSESSFENAYDWVWTDAVTDGEFTFYGLPAGSYEVRAFFSNGFEPKAIASFTVTKVNRPSTVFEDAEGGISDKWSKVLGNYDPRHATPGYNSSGILVLIPQWINSNTENASEFHLPLDHSTQFILEMDMGGLPKYKIPTVSKKGYMPHYSIGVYVKTKKGRRLIMWDSWFNHIHADSHIIYYDNGEVELNNPSPVEHVRGWYKPVDYWCHFRVDIEAALLNLEPDNKLIYVEKLYATGGFLDNIKLSSE